MNRVTRIVLRGFKTFPKLELDLRQLNVLIGPNGVGKSNLISFFRLLSYMVASPRGNLRVYVGQVGGAHTLLHDGPDRTREIEAELQIETEKGINEYSFRFFYGARDTLIFADERYRFRNHAATGDVPWMDTGAGHAESALFDRAEQGMGTPRAILGFLRQYNVHQFHNTSFSSRLRGAWNVRDNQYLKEDGANLAPVLLRMQESEPQSYRRVVETIRLIVPCFQDFELTPDGDTILLRWRELGTDMIFDSSQASDGTLRTFALVTLLGQLEERLSDVILLDEPELGLHPSAISVIGGMLRRVSAHSQVVIATQSVTLLDTFTPEDVLIVERKDCASTVRRLERGPLGDWLAVNYPRSHDRIEIAA